jgi:Ataxin-3
MSGKEGFICNSSAHWFAIRKIENVWYNLNSTNQIGPEIISDFYLR